MRNREFSPIVPKRYTSRELVKLAEEFGWRRVGVREDHFNFKHPVSRFIVTSVHPQKDLPVGRAVDTVKKIRLENPEFRDLLFAYVEVGEPQGRIAA